MSLFVKVEKIVRKPPGRPTVKAARIEDPSPLGASAMSYEQRIHHNLSSIVPPAVTSPEKLLPGGDPSHGLQLTAVSPAPLASTG